MYYLHFSSAFSPMFLALSALFMPVFSPFFRLLPVLLRLLAEDDILGLHGGAEVGLDDGASQQAPGVSLRLS
jgi:hypothetical protein